MSLLLKYVHTYFYHITSQGDGSAKVLANYAYLAHKVKIIHVGVNNIPPVTLATLALNIWLFLNPLKPLLSACLSVEKCYQQKDWQRLLLSPLHHADDWHLYFNMASMLWKGIKLERRLGSKWFAYIIATFSLLTGVVYLLLEFALAEFMNEPNLKRNCAVGFSDENKEIQAVKGLIKQLLVDPRLVRIQAS
ncbi:Rhomboid-related protein 4 [Camelus dromedarius]|uniref:Rhomboid-related protein 4 n=1 Tax=Camelus dromedarius TaxID=9838 RepID=A0A5N4E654_CAMDR|nr:Rhomboid-related protein 4 [Camelus dromedarius]